MSTYRKNITRYTRYIALLLVVFITTSKVQASEPNIKEYTFNGVTLNPSKTCKEVAEIATMAYAGAMTSYLADVSYKAFQLNPYLGLTVTTGGMAMNAFIGYKVVYKSSYEICKKLRNETE